jgi:signal transduction histidine kinase
VRRSDRLIRDLLDVSKIEAGKLSVEPTAHSVEGLLEQAVRDHEVLAEERELTLRVQPMPDGMPKVIADRTRIIQVLGNLIGNAIRFTEAGGTIDLEAEHHDSVVHIRVSDTGSGIPVETLPHIFNRYWQARQQRRAGAGLGLAIAKGIVEAHSGTIWVTSEQGVGTTFTFTLPIAG